MPNANERQMSVFLKRFLMENKAQKYLFNTSYLKNKIFPIVFYYCVDVPWIEIS